MNPERRLEDKFTNHKIELRPWTLNLNCEELHKNRELPGAFPCFLGVADSTLPLRGTAHRSVRGAPEAEAQLNALLPFESKNHKLFFLILVYSPLKFPQVLKFVLGRPHPTNTGSAAVPCG